MVTNNKLNPPVLLPKQIRNMARERKDQTAVVEIAADGSERVFSWRQLYEAMEKVAAEMDKGGIRKGSQVIIGLPNTIEHIVSSLAAWHLGACCIPISCSLKEFERDRVLGLVTPKLIVADWTLPGEHPWQLTNVDIRKLCESDAAVEDDGVPFVTASPGRAMATGGTTGKPKLVVQNVTMAYNDLGLQGWSAMSGQEANLRQLVPGSIYHTLYNSSLYIGLFMGHTIYLMMKFNPDLALELIGKYQIQCGGFVPTMLDRMMLAPNFHTVDLSSLTAIFHAGGACAPIIKKTWIERIGAEKIYEFYAMTEMIGSTTIRGDEWLLHEGSVGKPVGCSIRICSESGEEVPAGEVGEIFSRPDMGLVTYYIGRAAIRSGAEGYYSVGDLGYLDEDGYLYIVDRRSDMIVTGGKNVYCEEVESVMRGFPKIRDIVVIGLPDEKWGRKVHALMEVEGNPEEFPFGELAAYCHAKISSHKIPKSYEIVPEIPRDEMGKIKRWKLAEERNGGTK